MVTSGAIICGDCREVLAGLAAESVQTCVTSPPYWGLRDYGLGGTAWGGDAACEHRWGHQGPPHHPGQVVDGMATHADNARGQTAGSGQFCEACGAWRGCLGLEPTPELYVAHLVEVFRAVWRVLRPDGTLWLNLGDSYYAGGWECSRQNRVGAGSMDPAERASGRHAPGLKPKDLVGIPWRVAFALQADGWWLRQDIIWSKPNPMPESVTDRPTSAHEHLFLLTRSGTETYWSHRDGRETWALPAPDYRWRHRAAGRECRMPPLFPRLFRRFNLWRGHDYYYDAEAIREASVGMTDHDLTGMGYSAPGQTPHTGTRQAKVPAGWDTAAGAHGTIHRRGRVRPSAPKKIRAGRNKRSVWTIQTQAWPGAHSATMPEKLVEPCVLAGSRAGDLVLDPFVGSGTVGVVAKRHGRTFVGIDASAACCQEAQERIRNVAPSQDGVPVETGPGIRQLSLLNKEEGG